MTLWSTLFPDIPNTISRAWFKVGGGPINHAVPAGSKWCRATVRAAGGYGDNYGGGAAMVRKRFQVTPGENLVLQVGATSTQTVAGDSSVKRNDGTILAYADRGRGSGAGGLDSNSTGDIRRSGAAGSNPTGGRPGTDDLDNEPIMGPSMAVTSADFNSGAPQTPGPGGGGRIIYAPTEGGFVRIGRPGGQGLICLEFFDADPGL